MIPILQEIAEKSRWNLLCFNGKLHLSGRILSPIEAQAAGIASKTIMLKMYQAMKQLPTEEESEEEKDNRLLQQMEKLKPEDLLDFGKMQDRVICQVVDKASQDGEAFEKIHLVPNEGQQNPSRNILWVGLLSQDDKNLIFDAAMVSVKEATESVDKFRK